MVPVDATLQGSARMPSLITVLGSCLVAASAAAAADRPANPAGEPWWSNPPTAASPASGPKVPEYGAAVAAGPRSKAEETAPPGRDGPVPEFAPDPPGARPSHTMP